MKYGILKKCCSLICVFALLSVSVFDISAGAFNFTPVSGYDDDGNLADLELNSEAVYMMDMNTGDVLVNINADEQRSPASMTKIMTAIIMLDYFDGDPDAMQSTKYSAGTEAFDELYELGASTADIQPYEEVTCYDLLYALMLPSACEAANIIAIGMCGNVDDFVEKMNAKAEELGMENTHFANPHGLYDENNYSSCEDVAKMCTYAIENYSVFTDVVSTYSYTLSPTEYHTEGTTVYNTNYMLSSDSLYSYSYCRGIKTGTLNEAGRCLASYAVNNGQRYMTVTMGAPMEKKDEDVKKGEEDSSSVYAADTVYYNLIDHINLYEWAFNWLDEASFVDKSSELCEAYVEYGENKRDYVTLKPKSGFSKIWPTYISTDEVEQDITVYDNIVAPVYAGDELGMLTLTYEGEVIAEIPLVATESVARSKTAAKTAVAKAFPHSTEFKVAIVVIIAFAVVFTIVHIIRVQRRLLKKR
jgi:D-alanyl-D-alanine carboxypeptidase (penicillin-binding protein 5/6)